MVRVKADSMVTLPIGRVTIGAVPLYYYTVCNLLSI